MRPKKIYLLFLLLLLVPKPAFGVELRYPPVPGAAPPQTFTENQPPEEHFAFFLKYIYHLILTLSGLACFYAVVSGIAGYFFFNWRGAAAKSKRALEGVSLGVTGLVITLSSFLIVRTINPQILKFRMKKPELEMEAEEPGEPAEYSADYAEIPTGPLIEKTKKRAEVVRDQAATVQTAGRRVKTQAECVRDLSEQCKCDILELNCECTDPPECDSCRDVQCEGDPCDLPGTGCDGQPVNVREALERARAKLASYTDILEIEKRNLERLKENLRRANLRLKYAEALIRDREKGSDLFNYTSFVGEKQYQEDMGVEVEVEQIWKYEEAVTEEPLTQPDPYAPVRHTCDPSCRTSNAPNDETPCCWECGETLVCFGNDFKCDQKNKEKGLCGKVCASHPLFPESDPGDSESDGWPKSHPDLEEIIQYNGKTFRVPSNGIHYCDLNEPGCFYEKCQQS